MTSSECASSVWLITQSQLELYVHTTGYHTSYLSQLQASIDRENKKNLDTVAGPLSE